MSDQQNRQPAGNPWMRPTNSQQLIRNDTTRRNPVPVSPYTPNEPDRNEAVYAARAAAATGVPILTHLAIDPQPAIDIFNQEGLPLDRVLFGHADDGLNAPNTPSEWIMGQGGRIGFDTFGYETELPDPPFWARPRKERLDHFMDLVEKGHLNQLLASADANCSPLGWPGVKGHTVNYIFEDLMPDLRKAGLDESAIKTIFVDNPAAFLSISA